MDETADELVALQQLLDASFARASSHLTAIMSPRRRIAAADLVAALPSPAVLNLATVTARGEPRVCAVDGHFLHGRWYWTTSGESPKARQLRARPAVSASYTPRDGFGVFCHGRCVELTPGDELDMLIAHWIETYGMSTSEYGPAIFHGRIEAAWMVGFEMTHDEQVDLARAEAERASQRTAHGRA